MSKFKKLLFLLSNDERKRAFFLLIMIIFMAFLDVVGVASILPFISVLLNPEIIETNIVLSKAYDVSSFFGVESTQKFLFLLGIIVFLLLIMSLIFKALTSYAQVRFSSMREYSIGKRLLESYLRQPYKWFLMRNSSDLGKNILSEVGNVISKGLGPIMNLITQIVLTIALLILLIIVDVKITLISIFLFCLAYGLIYKLSKTLVSRLGKDLFESNQKRFAILAEAFGAFKEVKIMGLEQNYIDGFSKPAKKIAKNSALAAIISQLPRFSLEAIVFGGMIFVILYLMLKEGTDISEVIPIIALFAFAGYRLMPALQQIYVALTHLRIAGPSLDAIYEDLKSSNLKSEKVNTQPLKLSKDISLNHVNYKYPETLKSTINDISIKIVARSTVGFIGASGSGKTTTADIILSLLEANQGTLEVDGKIINEFNRRSWQSSIGYVPQQIFLADSSIASNIAFGVEPSEIDQSAVEKAAKVANLHDFVVQDLPLKYNTKVGEKGIRLSGGQRQRIGIARALYHKPQLLILDEATNSLDNITEHAVMDAVYNLKRDITIILITHHLNTIKKCDKVFLFNEGKIEAQGTFEELNKIKKNFMTFDYT